MSVTRKVLAQNTDEKEFTNENKTRFTIFDCFDSSVNTENWEEDILGVEMLNDCQEFEFIDSLFQ